MLHINKLLVLKSYRKSAVSQLVWLAVALNIATPMAVLAQKSAPAGVLFFNQLVEYQFVDVDGAKYDFQVLLNTKTGLWGFDKTMSNAIGWGEDLDFITASADGTYTLYGTDPHQRKVLVRYKLAAAVARPEAWQVSRKRFLEGMVLRTKAQKYQGLSVEVYSAAKPAIDGTVESVSIAKVPFNVYPLYLFNTLEGDAKLPCFGRLDFSQSLAPNELLVESVLTFPAEQKSSSLKLTFYTPTEYYFSTKGYK